MEYTIIFLDSVLEKDLPNLPNLPKKVRSRAIDAINERLTVDPLVSLYTIALKGLED